jgi:hypothetical protein
LLVNRAENLLPTVLSRCVVIKEPEGVFLAGREAPDEALQGLADEIMASTHTADILQAMNLYKKIEPFKDDREAIQTLLDMLYTGYGRLIREAGTSREAPDSRRLRAVNAVVHTKKVLAQNGNFQLAMELMLLKMSGNLSHTIDKVGAV